jgi:hypothetical protein
MLLAMLVEQHKQVLHLQQEIDVLQSTLRDTPSADGAQLLDDDDRESEQEG